MLPPAMLESYVANWPAPSIENFRYELCSGMLGWFSLMQAGVEVTLELPLSSELIFIEEAG